MKRYEKHRKKWKHCRQCLLHQQRKRVVLARGMVPCDVLFIGEAPGVSEDILGKPFVGPAGKLLDKIIERALDGQHDYALTNLVACIPLDENGNKTAEPPKACIRECAPRLAEFIEIANPSLVVFVGRLAAKHGKGVMSCRKLSKTIEIIHPAAILRMDVSQQGLAIQRSIVTLSDAVDELEPLI